MNKKKQAQTFWGPLLFMLILEFYVLLHIVHVFSIGDAKGLNAVINGVIEAFTRPFSLSGIKFTGVTLMMTLGVMGVTTLVMYNQHIDLKLNRNEESQEYKNASRWFGHETALLPAETTFTQKVAVVDKKTGEKTYKDVKKKMPDWEMWQQYYTSPYTKEDEEMGLTDPNFLIGKFDHSDPFVGNVKFSMRASLTNLNLLTLIFGGSGTGKTFRFLEPNLAQMNCSFAITDPSGEIFENMGKMLLEDGYRVWRFSTSDPTLSNTYNPLDYIYKDDGSLDQVKVAQIVRIFIKNAEETGGGKKGGDPFWEKSSIAWLTFAILYCAEFLPLEQRNFYQILKLAQYGKADEGSQSSQTMLGRIVDEARKQNPKAKCFEYFDIFNIAPAKTQNSILISIGVDLSPFAQDELRNLTSTSYVCKRNKKGLITDYIRNKQDELIRDNTNIDLRTLGDRKTALFIIPKTANDSYQFLVSIMYAQLFDLLYERAERVAKNSYHIYAKNGTVLTSEYPTEEAAKTMMQLYANAEIKTVVVDQVEHYYIYNADAKREQTMPEKVAEGKKGIGYLEEVYTPEVGQKLIAQYQSGYVQHGKLELPIHTRLLLDEFANISEIPNFEQFLSTMRKYQLSCTIILQTYAQLKQKYDKSATTIIGNCDTIVFLGSPDVEETCKVISNKLGKTAYKVVGQSQNKSNSGGSIGMSYKVDYRELMTPSELASLDNEYCIVMVRGIKPMKLKKLSFAEHKNFSKSGADSNHPENKLLLPYIQEHYRCLTKDKVKAETSYEEEAIASENLEGKDPATGKRKKTMTRGRKVRSKQEFAENAGVAEEQLDNLMKHATGITPEERNDTGAVAAQPAPENSSTSFEFSFANEAPKTKDPNTNEEEFMSPAKIDPDNSVNGQNEDDKGPNATAWVFM